MKITVDMKKLQNCLTGVSYILSKSSFGQNLIGSEERVLGVLCLVQAKDSKVTVEAAHKGVYARLSIPAIVEKEGFFACEGSMLTAVKAVGDTFISHEDNTIRIKNGRLDLELNVSKNPKDIQSQIPDTSKAVFSHTLESKALFKTMNSVDLAIQVGESQPIADLRLGPNIEAWTQDNYMASYYKDTEFMSDVSFNVNIPTSFVSAVLSKVEGMLSIGKTKNAIHLKGMDNDFYAIHPLRAIDILNIGSYISKFKESKYLAITEFDADELMGAIVAVTSALDTAIDTKAILNIKKDSTTVAIQCSSSIGKANNSVEFNKVEASEDMELVLNVHPLLKILRMLPKKEIEKTSKKKKEKEVTSAVIPMISMNALKDRVIFTYNDWSTVYICSQSKK